MAIANGVSALALAFWGLMSFAGIEGYISIENQHVPGYPNSGQAMLYLAIPLTIFVLILAAIIVFNRMKRGGIPLALLALATLFPIPIYMAAWSGGV
jgi:hypothetical protein